MKSEIFEGMLLLSALLTEVTFAAPPRFVKHSPDLPVWEVRYSYDGVQLGHQFFWPAVLDKDGNSYVIGYPAATVIKINSAGEIAWTTPLGEYAVFGYAPALVVDPSGNVYVSGNTYTPERSPMNYQDFVTWKLDPNGNVLWRVAYDPPDGTLDYSNGLGQDNAGDLYVVGRSYDFGIQAAYSTILKYDPNGHLLWARRYEPATNSQPHNDGSFAVNPNGGVVAIPTRSMASYSAAGELLWAREGFFPNAAFDRSNHLFATSVEYGGTRDAALIKFGPSGELLWRSAYTSPVEGGIYPNDLKVDAWGQPYVAAESPILCRYIEDDDELVLDCTAVPLILKYSPEGEQLWATRFSFATNLSFAFSGLALNSNGEPHLTTGIGYAGDEPLNWAFVAKCDTNGNQVWRAIYDASKFQRMLLVSPSPQVDRQGNVILSTQLIENTVDAFDVDFLLLKFQPSQPRPAPRVVTPPQPQTATTGATVTFSVNVTGANDLSYQWRFNSQPLPNATDSTLTLSSLQPGQAGDYSVEIRNKFGAVVTPEARLTVVSPPR